MDICDHDCFHCTHPDCIAGDDLTDAEYKEATIRDRALGGRLENRYHTDASYRESCKARCRDYYRTHKEVVKNAARAWRKANRERVNEWQRAYYRAHRDEILAKDKIRKAKKKAAASAGTETTAKG